MKKNYLLSTMILSVFLILCFTTSLALIPGDFGSAGGGPPDGCVDLEDLMILTEAYGSTSSDSNWNSACDIAGPDGTLTPDGVIDFEDLMVFAMHYGECDEDTSQSLITISDSAIFDGKTAIDGGEHTITVRFPAPTAMVRVFITNYSVVVGGVRNFWGIPSNAVEVFMSTVDGKTYTGTADFGEGDCDEEWIYVLTGDSCCPVIYSKTVIVDTKAPYVDLKAIVGEEENCGTECEPTPGKRVIITSDAYVENEPPLCTPLCCGDDCTELAEWTITVYDAQPYIDECGECVLDPCVSPIKVCTGTGCPVECDVFGCLSYDDWTDKTKNGYETRDYYVILEANDVVGNLYKGYGILTLRSDYTATLNDAELDENCRFYLVDIVPGDIERISNNYDNHDNIMGPCIYTSMTD
jgi:hypothetical protein